MEKREFAPAHSLELQQVKPELQALAWQNFLKRLANRLPLSEAKEKLAKEIKSYYGLNITNEPPLLYSADDRDYQKNVTHDAKELRDYLNGDLDFIDSSSAKQVPDAITRDNLVEKHRRVFDRCHKLIDALMSMPDSPSRKYILNEVRQIDNKLSEIILGGNKIDALELDRFCTYAEHYLAVLENSSVFNE